jgi:hypothetical protein
MFQRILLLEPWIEHAVCEKNVGCFRIAKRSPGAEAVVLPDPVYDNRIVSIPIGA